MHYVVLGFVSFALLLAIVALIKERRLRLALQQILNRLLARWRTNAQTQKHRHPGRHSASDDTRRL